MRRVLLAAVIGWLGVPAVLFAGYPRQAGYSYPPGYVVRSAHHGYACPYGYSNFALRRPLCQPYAYPHMLGQVYGPTTYVAGGGYSQAYPPYGSIGTPRSNPDAIVGPPVETVPTRKPPVSK